MTFLSNTTIIGKKNFPRTRNVLLIPNHLSMLDSWIIGAACFWPSAIWKPSLVCWHLPETKNYANNWFMAQMCKFWRCIPIRRGTHDFARKKSEMIECLQNSSLMIFGEGGRSKEPKSGKILRWGVGPADLAYQTKATIVPIAIRGMEDVLPKGKYLPRLFKKIVIVIGKPIEGLDALYAVSNEKEAKEKISKIMEDKLQTSLTSATCLLETLQN